MTSPPMYKEDQDHPSAREIAERLIGGAATTKGKVDGWVAEFEAFRCRNSGARVQKPLTTQPTGWPEGPRPAWQRSGSAPPPCRQPEVARSGRP